jgi:shikimate kinase/3-dehydroquinate synthase
MLPNIVVTGFMGTGKTSVGRELARRLKRTFIDMDDCLATREGPSVPEIFAHHGESYFREKEADLWAELSGSTNLVIATGGGTLVSPANRQLCDESLVVCLTCSEAEIKRRLARTKDRPLLASIEELLTRRQLAYAQLPFHVDTTGRAVAEVADLVLALYERPPGRERDDSPARQTLVRVPGGSYPVLVGTGLLARAGEVLRQHVTPGPLAVLTDRAVSSLYADSLLTSLAEAGFAPNLVEIPQGEEHKNLDTLMMLYDRLVDLRWERDRPVLALGGGVVGDVGGLAAATFMRGLPLVHIPTSLLAMVDSSLGGKVAVNHPRGKNLIGAFKNPLLVLTDPAVLCTLPRRELRSGLAEVVKAGLVGSEQLFEQLERSGRQNLSWIVWQAMLVKVAVVEQDPLDQAGRAVLNLGHTFGHAIELLSAYDLRHGEAVSIGLCVAARLAVRLDVCPAAVEARLVALLDRFDLPTRYSGLNPTDIWKAVALDKKRQGGRWRFVLPTAVGHAVVRDDVPKALMLEALAEVKEC